MLEPGTRLGPYEIVSPLGVGGMGEVYRARDTKLGRDVALKILPESFAGDPDRLMRFEREAKTLASLNHPNIGAIYGIEESWSRGPGVPASSAGAEKTPDVISRALVMELVEGEDLSHRIAQGAIALDDALPIARQIAEALEAAHDAGIIHRDLKPANIKVRADGTVKVLDFGLAKAMDPPSPAATAGRPANAGSWTPDSGPTMTSPAMTQMGMILGTAAYMSPEQAKGRAVDRRSDIWAFGAVLYEMLTGRRAFAGDDVSDLLVAVLSKDVDWTALPAATPASVRTLLRRCLERDPKRRLRDIGEAWLVLAHPEQAAAPAEPVSFASRPALALIAALLVACVALGLLWYRNAPTAVPPDAPAVRFPLVADRAFRVTTDTTQPFATSPDGRTIVFTADDGRGPHLWVRTVDAVEPRRLDGTLNGIQPAISPDGEWVAFVVGNYQLRKVRLSGGVVSTIASIDNVTAALTWLSDDEIAFEMIGTLAGIHRVNVNSGAPELLIPLDESVGEYSQRRPLALRPAGAVLYTSAVKDRESVLVAFSTADKRRMRLQLPGVQALGVIDGQLIYSRDDGVLMAVPFDSGALQVRGDARQLVEQVERTGTGTAVTLSENGTLVFSPPGSQAARLLIQETSGKTSPIGDGTRRFDMARFSPDGQRVAVGINDGDFQNLWVFDRRSGEGTRVTSGSFDRVVGWTDNSLSLIHLRNAQIWTTPIDRSAPPQPLVKLEGRISGAALVPGGKSLLAIRQNQGDLSGLSLVSIADGKAISLVAQAFSGQRRRPIDARVSPNGRWVAYTDRNEAEVHVVALDGSGAIQVSAQGGSLPVWGADSESVFYRTSQGLVRARLETTPTLRVSRTPVESAVQGLVQDVSPKDGAFLIVEPVGQGPGVQVAFGWAADVRRQLRK